MWITTNLHTFTISYDNPSLSAQIAESNAKLEKAQAEAKKAQEEAEKRRRMDNLDL
jgi:multidrug resistance efflux pump